jgi:cyanophycinase
LFDLFEKAGIDTEVNRLPDSSYFALLDHLEIAQVNAEGLRQREIANVPATVNPYSREIYQRFTDEVRLRAEAAGQEPQILVITSSSRDPFEVSDFYQSAFASMGVKTTWLPVDQALLYAWSLAAYDDKHCENLPLIRQRFDLFDRERVYPDRSAMQQQVCDNPSQLTELVASSQGVFFNGGDQSKTLASLFDASGQPAIYWQEIMAKVARHEMIVGGTSAGTAVHSGRAFSSRPIAMISSGTSKFALTRGVFAAIAPSVRCQQDACADILSADDVTYMPSGGSGLFPLGSLDTHFSERDREGRLIALALETHTQLSAGVDETTALLFGFEDGIANFEVIGERGVFFVDGKSQVIQKTINSDAKETQYAGYSHYLFSDTKASFDVNAQVWKILEGATLIQERKTVREADAGVWRNSTRRYCGSRAATSWELEGVNYVLAPETATQFFIDAKREHCGYLYLPFAVSANYELNTRIEDR